MFLLTGPTCVFEALFSSYVSACSSHCSFCSFDSLLLLAVLFCHFVQLSEILVELLLVVVQILHLCAPSRQSGFASFVDFFSPLTFWAVVLSLCSVFWRRHLQHSTVIRGSPQAPPTPLLSIAPLCDHWFTGGVRGPQHRGLQQRGLLFVWSGFAPSGLEDSLPLRFVCGLQHHCVILVTA